MIKQITYEDIEHIWKNYLWPERKSRIEPTSAMCYLNGYDLKNLNYIPTFFAFYENSQIAGVNSGHLCSDKGYRSRGLYVFENYRNRGIGTLLLKATIDQAIKEKSSYVWSYPKLTSWNTYNNAGFNLSSDWHDSELGQNAYCKLDL